MSRVVLGLWLVVVWVALWGRLTAANVISGIVVATVLLVVFPPSGGVAPRYVLHPVAAVRFAAYFVAKLVEANVALTREVVTRRDRIRTGVVRVPLAGVSDGLLTFVANMTALTPGTITVEVERDPAVLYVHILHLYDPEAVRADLRRLEALVIRAFGSPEARAALEQAEATP